MSRSAARREMRHELELSIEGMTCTNCAQRIERELSCLDGVGDATVSFATRRARICRDSAVSEAASELASATAADTAAEPAPGTATDDLAARAVALVVSLGYTVPRFAIPASQRGGSTVQEPASSTPDWSGSAATISGRRPPADEAGSAEIGGHRGVARSGSLRWHGWPLTAALAAGAFAVSMVGAWRFAGWRWFVGAAATVALFWGGRRILRAAWSAARHRSTTMDTLVSLGALTAWAWSTVQLLAGADAHLYFDAAAVIVAFVTLGRWLEDRALSATGDAVQALASLAVPKVRLADGSEIAAADLAVGMHFMARPGERIATDGVVTAGASAVDAAMMTGESLPVDVAPGDEIVGGTLNGTGALEVRATAVGADTALARIAELTRQAQDSRAHIGRLADRISAFFVPVAIGVAALTAVGWLIAGGLFSGGTSAAAAVGDAVTAAVAVLVISCPCALGLATPVALAVGVGRAAQLGVLVRGAQVFEDSRHVDTVVFDKTGTLTRGRMSLVEVAAPAWRGPDDDGEAALLALAACAESASEHPIGRAIAAAAATSHSNSDTDASQIGRSAASLVCAAAVPGLGITATLRPAVGALGAAHETDAGTDAGTNTGTDTETNTGTDAGTNTETNPGTDATFEMRVGKPELFATVPEEVAEIAALAEARGAIAVLAGRSDAAEGVIVVADEIEPSAAVAVASLHESGIATVLLTGDNELTARAIADEAGIASASAGVLPHGKVAEIARLQARGSRVAMVGDGINDAAALATADIGIAAASGTDIARSAADITLLSRDLRLVAVTLALSRQVLRIIRGNLFWAFAYNVAAIPLAATGVLHPMVAAGAMAASSLFVVGNALRLRRFDAQHRCVAADAALPAAQAR